MLKLTAQHNKFLSKNATTCISGIFHADHVPVPFLVATLVSPDNEIVASYALSGLDEDTISAPLVTTKRIFSNPESQAALYQMQESVFYDLDGRRLICRPINLQGTLYLLIVLTKSKTAYRRDLNQFCKKIAEVDETE